MMTMNDDVVVPRILLVAGFRKCGTSLLYSGLIGGDKLRGKDESWLSIESQILDWKKERSGRPLIIAKADALNCPVDLLSGLEKIGPCALEVIVVGRVLADRFESFLAHENKYGADKMDAVSQKFTSEIYGNTASIRLLVKKKIAVHYVEYEKIIGRRELEIGKFYKFIYTADNKNAANQKIRFSSALVPMLESRMGACILQLRDSRPRLWNILRGLFLNQSHSPKRHISGVGVGQISGATNGQQKMMLLALELPELKYRIDYRSKLGRFFAFLVSFFKGVYIRAFKKYDFVYLQPSRSNIGLLRDWAILKLLVSGETKVILHSHGFELGGFYNNSAMGWLKKWIVEETDLLITCNKKIYHEELIAIEQIGIDNPMTSKVAHEEYVLECERVRKYVYFSNIIPGKWLDRIIYLLNDGLLPSDIVVIGSSVEGYEGYYRDTKQSLEQLGVKVLTDQSHSDIEIELRQAEFLLFPSSYSSEAFPLTVIEAMNQGCIPVLTRHNALEKIFGELGCLFSKFDSYKSLATLTLISDAKKEAMRKVNHGYIRTLTIERWNKDLRKSIHKCFEIDFNVLEEELCNQIACIRADKRSSTVDLDSCK